MRDVIYVKLDIDYIINQQLNETISRKSYFFETVKSKVIISLFETVRLSVSISPRNLYKSLKSIKESLFFSNKQLFSSHLISCCQYSVRTIFMHRFNTPGHQIHAQSAVTSF